MEPTVNLQSGDELRLELDDGSVVTLAFDEITKAVDHTLCDVTVALTRATTGEVFSRRVSLTLYQRL